MAPFRHVGLPMAVGLALVLGACARDGAEPTREPFATDASPAAGTPSAPAASRQLPATIEPDESMPPVIGEAPDDLLARIVADAAERTGLPEAAFEIVRAQAVTWNDGSLGCPEPGMVYTQALIDGYHVVLEADDRQLDYRTQGSRGFKLCERPGPPGPGASADS